MTEKAFTDQIQRLKARFGDKAFDVEFTKLIAAECVTMQADSFSQLVSFFIGGRPANRPPLLQDFRDGRINEEKKGFQREVAGAAQATYGNAAPQRAKDLKPIGDILAPTFPGCKSVKEAFEVAKLKIQIEKAKQEPPNSQENAVPFDFGPEPG